MISDLPTPPARRAYRGEERVVEVQIPSDVQYIERVVELVRKECEVSGVAAQHLALHVPVALTEALSNAILYGNGDDPAKQVSVRACVDSLKIVIEVRDEGAGFDLDASTLDPTTPEHVLSENGRGLFLMRELMDEVERLAAVGGNVVRLTLRRQ